MADPRGMEFAFRNIAIDCNDLEGMTAFWSSLTGFEVVWESAIYKFLRHPDGRRPGIVMQKVPERPSAKTRIHVDLDAVGVGDEDEAIAHAESLGAELVERHAEFGVRWTVMRDPEGNVFCIQTSDH
ncbi:MAG: VOC family protein [Actinomycetota bacterium]|nr:VOC family protein [Actinomycetota bacterium]